MHTKSRSFADARRRYNYLVRLIAKEGTNLTAAYEIGDLYGVLGIDARWVVDDLDRLERGLKPKPIEKPAE